MKTNIFFASLKSMKKEIGSGDPDPHQNVTNPQHWIKLGRGVAMLGKNGWPS